MARDFKCIKIRYGDIVEHGIKEKSMEERIAKACELIQFMPENIIHKLEIQGKTNDDGIRNRIKDASAKNKMGKYVML